MAEAPAATHNTSAFLAALPRSPAGDQFSKSEDRRSECVALGTMYFGFLLFKAVVCSNLTKAKQSMGLMRSKHLLRKNTAGQPLRALVSATTAVTSHHSKTPNYTETPQSHFNLDRREARRAWPWCPHYLSQSLLSNHVTGSRQQGVFSSRSGSRPTLSHCDPGG